MQRRFLACLALAGSAACAAASHATTLNRVTPIEKVVTMLNEMAAKGKQEKQAEETAYAKFAEFCRLTSAEKARSIKAATERIAVLQAAIDKAQADASGLQTEIAGLDSQIAAWNAELKSAQELRQREDGEYTTTRKDYSESIDALERAVATLKANAATLQAPQVAMLAQLSRKAAKLVSPAEVTRTITSALQLQAGQTPEARAYEFQSGGIVETLQKLRERFIQELRTLDTEETNRRHNFELLSQQLRDDTGFAEKSRNEKTALRASLLESAATNKGDLGQTETDKAADETYARDLDASCQTKATEFQSRQSLRAAEIEAIEKAVGILSSDAVAGAAQEHLPSLLQKGKRTVLAQLRRRGGEPRASQAQVAKFLQQRAQEAKNSFMASIADRVAQDPFAKVKQMIKDLLTRLMEEANAETSHKSWCNVELATNQKTREGLTSEVDRLTAQVDELSANLAKLEEDIADLSSSIASINDSLAKAAAQRQEEKAQNAATVQEAKAAQVAVMEAVRLLREFYEGASGATALLQRQQPPAEAPATWDKAYTGMQAEHGGIVGFLEVIQSDFARLETETSTNEDEAQREYERLVADSETDRAAKDTDLRHKTHQKENTARSLTSTQRELQATQAELTAADDYFSKLKPTCIDTGLSYEDRVAKRREEIESLKEALRMLEAEDLSGA